MRNFVATGDVFDVLLAAAAATGDVIVVGDMIAVAAVSGAIGDTIAAEAEGVFALPKATGAGSATGMGQGKQVYWDATGKLITTTSTSNNKAGVVFKAPLDADATVQVSINENSK